MNVWMDKLIFIGMKIGKNGRTPKLIKEEKELRENFKNYINKFYCRKESE